MTLIAVAANNGGGGAFYRFTSLVELREERKPEAKGVLAKQRSLLD